MPHRLLRRRALLIEGALTAAAVVGLGGLEVERGVLPGRPALQAHLGLNGEDGVVPDVARGPVETGTFVSRHRLGAATSWSILRPPGHDGRLPVVVALHGLGDDQATLTGPTMGLGEFLAAAVAAGVPPFAIATVDGGTTFFCPQPSGEDAGAMVVEEFLPLLADHGLDTERPGLLGWSMGGYGVLRLGGLLGAAGVSGIVATSPAVWTDAGAAVRGGFPDRDLYDEVTVVGRQGDLAGIPVRIDCGTGDDLYRPAQRYAAGFPDGADVTAGFEPGAHGPAYWRRKVPVELEFLGTRVGLRA